MLQRFPWQPPESSRPGVTLTEADFTAFGAGRVPFSGGRFIVAPGATSRPDTHQVSECWMVAQGQGRVTYAGQDAQISAGDFVFFETNRTHVVHNTGDENLVIHTVWWLEP